MHGWQPPPMPDTAPPETKHNTTGTRHRPRSNNERLSCLAPCVTNCDWKEEEAVVVVLLTEIGDS